MKKQATLVINANSVNDAHTAQLNISRKKSNSNVVYKFKISCL